MRILHTADWHIGQLFHQHDRTYEHQQFLNWLVLTLRNEKIDVLLISGDVFDVMNPAAHSIRLFYNFLRQAINECPALQIVVTAGNHDSPSRLEMPKPLLESSNIHLIGLIRKEANGNINHQNHIIPIMNSSGQVAAWCLAVPFLRMGDYPVGEDGQDSYVEGVRLFYQQAFSCVQEMKAPGQAIIAMGHLHAQQAEVGDIDLVERPIMGGVECISASAFDPSICYVALGHIHKAQCIGGKPHIRYSGSPLPMSFTEIHYQHQVVVFEIEGEGIKDLSFIEIPVAIPLCRVPSVHKPLAELMLELEALEAIIPGEETPLPYLEVRVLCDGPEPSLRKQIQKVLDGKKVRLTKIDVKYNKAVSNEDRAVVKGDEQLKELQPVELLQKIYQKKYGKAIGAELVDLFTKVMEEIHQKEN